MIRYCIVLGLLMLCITGSAQDWVEHGGAEYNCSVLGGILAEFGDSDLSRSGGRAMTVAELFAMMFPSCPAPADTISTEASTNIDVRSSDALYTFSSDEAGMQPVLGPLTLPAGVYVFTARTDGRLSASPQSLSGDCGFDLMVGIFNLSSGEGADGSQSVVEAETDCQVLLEISNNGDAWTLDVVAANNLPVQPVDVSYSASSAEGRMQPVLGPFGLSAGVYVFTARTDGRLSVSPQSLSGDCGFDLMVGIFNLSSGEGTDGAQSIVEVEKDCDVLLEIGNGGDDWLLDFKKIS